MFYTNKKLLSIAISASLLLTACNQEVTSSEGEDYNTKDNNTDTSFNQLALVTQLTDNVITPTFEAFKLEAQKQTERIDSYCINEHSFANDDIDEATLTASKASAQEQWRNTINVWQQAELMQLGPLLNEDGLLRNKIYSWPTVKACGIDYDVMYFRIGTVNGQPYNIDLRTPSRKGLDALEYLLFTDSTEHSCEVTAPPPNWLTLTHSEIKTARCDFALEVAKDITNNADLLLEAWNGETGYANTLRSAGTTNSTFTTEHEAVNALSDSLFYLDSITKDAKLATPLGILTNPCGSSVCVEKVESVYAQHSFTHIHNNLIGFQKLLSGDTDTNNGLGFIEYLIDVGAETLATEMAANVDKAINTLNTLDTSLTETLETDPDKVEQLHSEVKSVTDQLKTDFITSLALELPATSAGDND